MDLGDLIKPEGVIANLKARNKKQVLQILAAKAAQLTGSKTEIIYEILLQRERLGSTAYGRGLAIPHGKLPELQQLVCLFAKLDDPVDFEALDNQPVDLVFVLLAPEHTGADHLKALARISRLLRDPLAIEKLRASRDRTVLFSVLTEPLASHAA